MMLEACFGDLPIGLVAEDMEKTGSVVSGEGLSHKTHYLFHLYLNHSNH